MYIKVGVGVAGEGDALALLAATTTVRATGEATGEATVEPDRGKERQQ